MNNGLEFAGSLPRTHWTPPRPIEERLILVVEFNSPAELRTMSEEWFDALSTHTCPLARSALNSIGAQEPVVGLPGPPGALGEPWGAPGSWLGRGWLARWVGVGRLTAKDVGWTPGLPARLAKALAAEADIAQLSLDLLDGSGHVAMHPVLGGVDHLHLKAERMRELPGLAKFTTAIAEDQLTGVEGAVVQRRWLDALETWSRSRRIRWGGLDLATNIFTLLAETAPEQHEWDTLEENEWIRGFGWLTWLSQQHVRKLGGLEGLASGQVFARVIETSGGGALLQ